MYQPLFNEDRIEVLHDLIRSHPLTTLVSSVSGKLSADHIPVVLHPELSDKGTLRGHIHKGNPLWRNHTEVTEVMAIFQGAQSYVTPTWYPSKKEHGKTVPTWNYVVVHARGKLCFKDDRDWLMEHLIQLSDRHESDREEPWKITDAPDDYINRQLRGIVGLELTIESLEGTWKVSQNRDSQDRNGVQKGLLAEQNHNSVDMAELVRVHKN